MFVINKKIDSLILFVLLLGVLLFLFPASTSALTDDAKQNCRDNWQGTIITRSNEDNFKKSQCYKSDFCSIKAAREVGEGDTPEVVQRGQCKAVQQEDGPGGTTGSGTGGPSECSDIETSIVDCNTKGGNPITGLLLQIVNFLAVGVGIAVVGGIIWGGMVYASSNGDASKVQQAKMIIVNAVVGLLLFFFMYALINYLVPGGLFN